MGFLAPAFLAALAAIAAPLYLHLLRRQTTTPRPFSSLMFFEPRTQASIRHRRLRYLWLLALRVALVGLLVLAFADPFLLRPAASVASNHLTLLVVDNSLSMQATDVSPSRLAAAKAAAASVLERAGGRIEVAALASQLHLLSPQTADKSQVRAALATIAPSDERADFAALARGVRTLAETTRAPIQIELFSDFKRSSLPPSFADLALPAGVSLAVHRIGGAPANWTITSLQGPARLYGSPRQSAPARFQAVVTGYNTPAARRTITLDLDGRALASQTVTVPAAGAATATFPSVVVPYGWSRLSANVTPADALAADDAAFFSVYRSDPERILFVHAAGETRSAFYVSAALGDAFTLDSVSVAQAADERPRDFALVILDDLPSVPDALARALRDYVSSGGGVLLIAGSASHDVPFFGRTQPQNYGERAVAVASSDSSHPINAGLGPWAGVRFFFSNRVAAGDSRVLARLSDQTPLLLDQSLGHGHALLFASGLDNLTNDLPLHAIFVPWVQQTARYLAGDALQAGGSSPVGAFQSATQVTDPRGGHPLQLGQSATSATFLLGEQGFYQIQRPDGRAQVIAVNADRRESDLSVISSEDLALWRGTPVPATSGRPEPAPPDRVPVSLWWYIMLVLLAVAVCESVLAARYLGVSRSEENVLEEGVIHERS